jgi:hypothetical protein
LQAAVVVALGELVEMQVLQQVDLQDLVVVVKLLQLLVDLMLEEAAAQLKLEVVREDIMQDLVEEREQVVVVRIL